MERHHGMSLAHWLAITMTGLQRTLASAGAARYTSMTVARQGEGPMARMRANETANERSARVKKNAQDVRDASSREDDEMDAMVQKSMRLQGP